MSQDSETHQPRPQSLPRPTMDKLVHQGCQGTIVQVPLAARRATTVVLAICRSGTDFIIRDSLRVGRMRCKRTWSLSAEGS